MGGTKIKGGVFPNNSNSGEPVIYCCYQISQKKEDLWIAVIGCISDSFIPDFYEEFEEKYPELSIKFENVKDIFYKSQIGKAAQILNGGLKDRITNVINMLRFLIKSKSPHDVLEETSKNRTMHDRFKQINSKFEKLVEKARKIVKEEDKLLFFKFGGDLSVSGEVSNYLSYLFPEKVVVVAYVTEVKANISVRGRGVRKIVLKAIEDIEDSTGGGHRDAVGVGVKIEDLEKFRKNMEKSVARR
ncbi:DHH family phosphoesterase [archaeon]|nr:DHH family phosphoesterase [archaeon]